MKAVPKIIVNALPMSITAFLLLIFSLSSLAETQLTGERHYKQCSACHLASGAGVPGMFPSLTKRLGPLADSKEGREYLVMVIQAGLTGRLSIDGVTYQGIMPAQGSSLGDDGIALVLNYVLQAFNAETLSKTSLPFTEKEVVGIKARHAGITPQEVNTMRKVTLAVEQASSDTKYDIGSSGTRQYGSQNKGFFLKMLVDQKNLGGNEVEIAEMRLPGNYQGTGHLHQSTEIFYILSGELTHRVNGNELQLSAGMVGMVRPGDSVEHIVNGDTPVKLIVVWVPGGEGSRFLQGKVVQSIAPLSPILLER